MAGFNTTERIEEDGEWTLRMRRPLNTIIGGCFGIPFLGFWGLLFSLFWLSPSPDIHYGNLAGLTLVYLIVLAAFVRYLRDRPRLTLTPTTLRVHRAQFLPKFDRVISVANIFAILRFESRCRVAGLYDTLPNTIHCELDTGERIDLAGPEDGGAINTVESWLRERLAALRSEILWEQRVIEVGPMTPVTRRPYRFPFSEQAPWEFHYSGWHTISRLKTRITCDGTTVIVEEKSWRTTQQREWRLDMVVNFTVELTEEPSPSGEEQLGCANLLLQLHDGATHNLVGVFTNSFSDAEVVGWIAALLNRRLACEVSGTTDGESVRTVD